jgi:hypothetical protein
MKGFVLDDGTKVSGKIGMNKEKNSIELILD